MTLSSLAPMVKALLMVAILAALSVANFLSRRRFRRSISNFHQRQSNCHSSSVNPYGSGMGGRTLVRQRTPSFEPGGFVGFDPASCAFPSLWELWLRMAPW